MTKIKVYSAMADGVIRSSVSLAETNYSLALEKLVPLMGRFVEQRKIQGKKFYDRLRKDILKGCVVPPITLAFVNERISKSQDTNDIQDYVNKEIDKGYILDGMQRLNTLLAASDEPDFDDSRPLPVSIIVAERYDFLLYRMITLNNGQKPMTARHQIEMLTRGLFDTERLNINVITEKETEGARPRGGFKRSDISEAYVAFMSNSLHNQNARIVEAKLDEILVGKVMDSDIFGLDVSFEEVLNEVDRLSADEQSKEWLRLGNNLIGFAVGLRESFKEVQDVSPQQFGLATQSFEVAFDALETSKVNVGKVRREFAREFVRNIDKHVGEDEEHFTEVLNDLTL